jgi:hypothetical protein
VNVKDTAAEHKKAVFFDIFFALLFDYKLSHRYVYVDLPFDSIVKNHWGDVPRPSAAYGHHSTSTSIVRLHFALHLHLYLLP